MNNKSIVRAVVAIALAAVMSVSCVTNRQVAYLQDMKHNTQIGLENDFEAVISPYDELDIYITCFDSELAKPFNISSSVQSMSQGGGRAPGYLVDHTGNIEMPVLGSIHAAGMTRLKLQDHIKNLLISGGYINDPFVMVRFRNFKIFFLGSNGGKAITIENERCTLLEALALSGDMNIYTDRKKVAVMREVDGRMVMRYLDPRSSKVFNDPYFMLQQNDFIITRDTGYRNFMNTVSNFSPIISVIGWGTSLVSLILTYSLYNSNNSK